MVKVSVILSFYNCEKYLKVYFDNVLSQKNLKEIELSIVHNSPSKREKLIIEEYKSKINIKYQEVERETLYKSWNRAIKQSTGKYLVCWNVDDLRTNDSIYKMVKTLEKNNNIGFTYGDFIITKSFGSKLGSYITAPDYDFNLGKSIAIGGPFFMWKKELVTKIGFFDEQFISGGDLDYTIRLSRFSNGLKTNGLLGYFLNDKKGLSTKNIFLQIKERTIIQKRYRLNKINLFFYSNQNKYEIHLIKEFDVKRKIQLEQKKFKLIDITNMVLFTMKDSFVIMLRIIKRLIF